MCTCTCIRKTKSDHFIFFHLQLLFICYKGVTHVHITSSFVSVARISALMINVCLMAIQECTWVLLGCCLDRRVLDLYKFVPTHPESSLFRCWLTLYSQTDDFFVIHLNTQIILIKGFSIFTFYDLEFGWNHACFAISFKFLSCLSQTRSLEEIYIPLCPLKINDSIFINFFSVRLLSFLRGHSVFSSPPQRPMTSDFEGFLSQILSITFLMILW